jgi:hypothetical protein
MNHITSDMMTPLSDTQNGRYLWNPRNTNSIDGGSFWKIAFTFPGDSNQYFWWTPGKVGMLADYWLEVVVPGTYSAQHPTFPSTWTLPHKVRGGSTQYYAFIIVIEDWKGVNYNLGGDNIRPAQGNRNTLTVGNFDQLPLKTYPSNATGGWHGMDFGTMTLA